jgi:hypothetical protein
MWNAITLCLKTILQSEAVDEGHQVIYMYYIVALTLFRKILESPLNGPTNPSPEHG